MANRHIKAITCDRAGAFAKAVEEILPDCMQVADRFHIHKNLMDYVNQILKRELPSNIKFIEDDVSKETAEDKKIESIVDNFTECKKKREQLILQIREYAKITTNMSEIARIYKLDRRTVKNI